MSYRFYCLAALVIVRAEVAGPARSLVLSLALDTGAISTMLSGTALRTIGCSADADAEHIEVTTASGIEFAPLVHVQRLEALGQVRSDFSVVMHNLPASAGVDGLLGLDFLRGKALTIDFRAGEIILA
jgi:predicted aspartyl protease